MKKCFVIGLIMALVPGMCPAVYTRISDLTAEKLEKMKRLEKCQGTTKGLKIAGLSTLGITAVGVAGNIAEAVVLNEYKDKVNKEKKELSIQQDLNKQLWNQRSAQLAANQPQTVNTSNFETIDRFSALKVSYADAIKKINEWDKEIESVALSGCEQPIKTSSSNDNYNDSVLCHGNDKDYLFRFGIITDNKDNNNQVKKYDSIADCYEACQKPARCEIRSEAQSDFSVKTWYECATESKAIAGTQLVRDFENQSFAPADAVKKIANWEITHEEMSGCDEPNFTDNSILCHAKKDNASYKFLFKELQTNETGFTEERACKEQCNTMTGCSQLASNKRWQCVSDLPENKIEIADYKPFTDGVKCMDYCAETCEYVAATKDSPVLYRCYKSKEQAAKEQKQRAELDAKAAEMYAPRLAGLRAEYVEATNECITNKYCPQINMTDLAKAYRDDFAAIVAETDKVKDKVTPFDKNREASIVEDTIKLQENKYANNRPAPSAEDKLVPILMKELEQEETNAMSADRRAELDRDADAAFERAEKQMAELQKKYCKNCSTDCNMHYYKFKDGSEFIGVSCPDNGQEKYYDDNGVEIQKPVEQTQPAPIPVAQNTVKQQEKFKPYQDDIWKQDVGGTWIGDTFVRLDRTGKMKQTTTVAEMNAKQKALAEAKQEKEMENKVSAGAFRFVPGKQYEK